MIHSFLLIGQSNMAGRGFLNEAREIDKTHIKVLRNGLWYLDAFELLDYKPDTASDPATASRTAIELL